VVKTEKSLRLRQNLHFIFRGKGVVQAQPAPEIHFSVSDVQLECI
jgi:hypothetical protein